MAAGKKYFGTATDTNEFTDTTYVSILSNTGDFGQLTPLNSMKWVGASSLLHIGRHLKLKPALSCSFDRIRPNHLVERSPSLMVIRLSAWRRRMARSCAVRVSIPQYRGCVTERTQNAGHNCVWYNQLPSWVTSSNFNSSALTSVIQTHCSTLVGHYKGEM